jgi:predicted phage tail protein
MKEVVLHGILRKLTCPRIQVKVDSFDELISCLLSNFEKLNSRLYVFLKKAHGLIILADDKIIANLKTLNANFHLFKKLELIPVSRFCIAATATIAFTAIKVNALLAFAINTIIFAVISIGISLLISKLLSPKQPNQVKTSSYIFSSKENLAQRNASIPLSYGRLRLNSYIVSSILLNFDLTSDFDISSLSSSASSGLLSANI